MHIYLGNQGSLFDDLISYVSADSHDCESSVRIENVASSQLGRVYSQKVR